MATVAAFRPWRPRAPRRPLTVSFSPHFLKLCPGQKPTSREGFRKDGAQMCYLHVGHQHSITMPVVYPEAAHERSTGLDRWTHYTKGETEVLGTVFPSPPSLRFPRIQSQVNPLPRPSIIHTHTEAEAEPSGKGGLLGGSL